MSRFVRPDTKVLKISQGDTLTVKRRLNHGEQSAAFARMYLAGVDGQMRVNPMEVGLQTIVAYLVDWSLTDDNGKLVIIRDQPVETVVAALHALSPEDFAEIRAAIDAHEAAMQAERSEEKKLQASPPVGAAISPSPSAPVNPSSGSETLM
jgi:hypothetical protein